MTRSTTFSSEFIVILIVFGSNKLVILQLFAFF
jgi:hypothetical protein